MSFERDLQNGAVAEIALRRWADSAGFYSQAAVGRNPAWDVLLRASIEVKNDSRTPATGNFFLETHSHGKPSGISISQATTYGLVTGKGCYLVGVELLRSILPQLVERPGPDEKRGRLLPIKTLLALPHHAIDLREFLP
jgi:hypothetical protein